MKCINCEFEVDPNWTYAIDSNKCPRCGKDIMEAKLKELLTTLSHTMDQLEAFKEQMQDWMLSKFNLINKNSADLIKYVANEDLQNIKSEAIEQALQDLSKTKSIPHVAESKTIKMKIDGKEQEVVVEQIQSEERNSEFFKRAEAVKPRLDGFKSVSEKTAAIKEMAERIRKTGSLEDQDTSLSNIMSDADPEAIADMQNFIIQEQSGGVQSSIGDSDDGEEIPAAVLAMANMKNTGNPKQSADIAKLQAMRERVAESRKNFSSGAKGSFSRG